jgi:rhamnosyltransferase subunit B
MEAELHAILVTVGTDGDVFPYVGLGIRLRARGHRVTLVATAHFEALASSLDFGFQALVSDEETEVVLADPNFWHPIKGGAVAARWGTPFLRRQYDLISELVKDEDAILVASPGVLPARLVQEMSGKPMATVVLQPGLIPSITAPPIMPGITLPRGSPRWVGELYWRLVDVAGSHIIGRHLNRVRAALGLSPVPRVFRWWYSPDLVIGMFPDWYGPRPDDWPSQIRLAGFPLYDGRADAELSPEIRRFLDEGDPPIVFTFGTGMMHAAELFRKALEVCRSMGVRGVFLTKYGHQVPTELRNTVAAFDFAPFLRLFPRCAAVVHHGGVGTVAKALKTGTPQLILPMAWDQMDNASRVKRLDAGDSLKPRRRSTTHIADALAGVMSDATRTSCRHVAERFGEDDALGTAAIMIEDLAARHLSAHTSTGLYDADVRSRTRSDLLP